MKTRMRGEYLTDRNCIAACSCISPLQHCVFFDGTLSGVVRPIDTYKGFYALGFGVILSVAGEYLHSEVASPDRLVLTQLHTPFTFTQPSSSSIPLLPTLHSPQRGARRLGVS